MAKRINQQKQKQRSPYADDSLAVTLPSQKARLQSRPLQPKTEGQSIYMECIREVDLVFGLGPAGTGKTYIAAGMAAEALMSGKTQKIIVTRPAVEAGGESLGFLPGELEEKYEPYLQPVRQILTEKLGKGAFDCALKNGKIEPVPLGYMRGRTFDNCWVILDEAQNVSPAQMKMFLTRIGENCKVIVCGDTDQVDIPGESGLRDAVHKLEGRNGVEVSRFTYEDVVRSGLCLMILKAYAGVEQDF